MKVQWLESVKNRRKSILFAVCVNLLVMAAMVMLMRPSFETNDDIVFAEFGSGLRGVKDAHLVFQNYILGLIYRFLYQVTGRLPWYTIFQYVVLAAAFSAVTYVLMNRLEGYSGLYLSVIFLCCFGYEAYIHIQFTKTAGIASGAAVFLLLHTISRHRFSVPEFLWGIGLGVFGFLYREDQFWASCALMAGAGLYFLLGLRKKYSGKALRKLGVFAGSFLFLLISVAAAGAVDSHMYRDSEWQEYLEFNDLRSKLLDYGFPDYDSSADVYQELGITREAYELYKTWNFNDPQQFTAEMMEKLVLEKEGRIFQADQIIRFLKRFPSDLTKIPMAWFALVFLVIWLLLGEKNLRAAFSLLSQGLMLGVLYFYLYFQGRYMVNRVDVGLWSSVCLVLLWLVSDRETAGETVGAEKERNTGRISSKAEKAWKGKIGVLVCAAVLLFSQLWWRDDWRIFTSSIPEARVSQRAVLETIGTDKDHVYIAKSGTVSEIVCYGPFDRMPENLLDNLYWLGGWECRTPGIIKEMEEHGIANPYKDMIDNDKVYLIDNQIEQTLAYIRQYYDKDAEAVHVRTLGNVELYQIKG